MKYSVEIKSRKTGVSEVQDIETDIFDLLQDYINDVSANGYSVIGYQEIIGENHSESKLFEFRKQ